MLIKSYMISLKEKKNKVNVFYIFTEKLIIILNNVLLLWNIIFVRINNINNFLISFLDVRTYILTVLVKFRK